MSPTLAEALAELEASTRVLHDALGSDDDTALARAMDARTRAFERFAALAPRSGPDGAGASLDGLQVLEQELLSTARAQLGAVRDALHEAARIRAALRALHDEAQEPRFQSRRV